MPADDQETTDGRTRRPLPLWVIAAPLPADPQRRADAVRQLRVWAARHSWAWTEVISARRLHAERADRAEGGETA